MSYLLCSFSGDVKGLARSLSTFSAVTPHGSSKTSTARLALWMVALAALFTLGLLAIRPMVAPEDLSIEKCELLKNQPFYKCVDVEGNIAFRPVIHLEK